MYFTWSQRRQQVSIEGFRAKNGSNTCNSRVVTTADGKRLFARSSFGSNRAVLL